MMWYALRGCTAAATVWCLVLLRAVTAAGLPAFIFRTRAAGFDTAAELNVTSNFGLAIYGPNQALDAPPKGAAGAAKGAEQCRQVKARSPGTKCYVYRQGWWVMDMFDDERAALADPDHASWWLREPNSSDYAPGGKPGGPGQLWDFRNASARAFFAKILRTAVASPSIDGVFMDDALGACANTEHVWPGWSSVSLLERHEMCNGTLAALRGAVEAVAPTGKPLLLSLFEASPAGKEFNLIVPRSTVYAALPARGWASFTNGLPDPGFGEPCEQLIADAITDTARNVSVVQWAHVPRVPLNLSLAVFLLGYAPGSYFGASSGWGENGWDWHPEFDLDYGEPLGPPLRGATPLRGASAGEWQRNFTRCSVRVNCAAKTSSVEFH